MISNNVKRRNFLKLSSQGFGAFFLGSAASTLSAQQNAVSTALYTDLHALTSLNRADENGVRLPDGFKSRIVARSSEAVVSSSSYLWHAAPDGGDCYATPDGGWIYVSNSEVRFAQGGVGAIRFSANGDIVDSYPILEHSNNNCAGGKTPWQTWLSCEEVDRGIVYECDPFGQRAPVPRPALGRFKHEAVTVDPVNSHLYLTEDEPDGNFYRFVPDQNLPELDSGTLQVAQVTHENGKNNVVWHDLNDAYASYAPTRQQVSEATVFKGGEGMALSEGVLYFTTKHDNKVWAYDIAENHMTTLYDIETSPTPILSGVDNVTISASGDVLIAEDGGDMQIVLLGLNGEVLPVMQVVGHDGSEITGPAFSPDFSRLYFSSQRGPENDSANGITYEISRI